MYHARHAARTSETLSATITGHPRHRLAISVWTAERPSPAFLRTVLGDLTSTSIVEPAPHLVAFYGRVGFEVIDRHVDGERVLRLLL